MCDDGGGGWGVGDLVGCGAWVGFLRQTFLVTKATAAQELVVLRIHSDWLGLTVWLGGGGGGRSAFPSEVEVEALHLHRGWDGWGWRQIGDTDVWSHTDLALSPSCLAIRAGLYPYRSAKLG